MSKELFEIDSNKTIHDVIEDIRDNEEFGTASQRWRDYAQGNHDPVADPGRQKLLGDMDLGDMQEDLIGQCLDQIAARIKFKRFAVADEQTQDYLNDLVVKNQLQRAVVSLMKRVQTDGNGAMSVSYREDNFGGRVRFHHESWWDGDKGVFIRVDDGGEVLWAVSDWITRDNERRRTLYLHDRVIRYAQEGDGWQVIEEIPWVRADGSPLGVPFAHFGNGASAYGQYGQSTVQGVISTQNALNASLFNRQAVTALAGAQIYYVTGAARNESVEVSPGQLWSFPGENVKVGVLPPGNLTPLLEDTQDLRGVIAGAFPVPSYRIGRGDWPSGLALQRADSPMVARVQLLENVTGPGLSSLAHRATELVNHFQKLEFEKLDESKMIEVEWFPSDEVDPGTQVEINKAMAEMFSMLDALPKTLVTKMGILDADELESYLAERETESVLVGRGEDTRDRGF